MIPMIAWNGPGASAAPTVQQEEFVVIELRVTSARPRVAIVDRGTIDGLARGDRVVFRPRDGVPYEGTIVRIEERVAAVELDDPAFVPQPGTRGETRVPKARLDAARVAPPATQPDAAKNGAPGAARSGVPDHPPWERTDDEWTPEEPLLAKVRPLRPAERESRTSGRVYTIYDYAHSSEGSRSDSFARVGTDLTWENAFGNGGDLHVDGEFNARSTTVPDDDDESTSRLRLDRLSYSWGGNRFQPNRFELGRFLQHEAPEFGVLDGFQWGRRLSSGNTIGASIGYIPEPDGRQSTGDDLQVAAYYRFVADESEMLSMLAGYQKTFHHMDADRDLFVAKLLYLPPVGWNVSGTAWIDYYDATDTAKGSGFEVTQAYLSTGRRFDGGSSIRFTYTHMAFPEIERNEFLPVTNEQLAKDRSDRVTAFGRQTLGGDVAIFERGGVWSDEDDDGTDAELGLEFDDFLVGGLHVEAAGFGVDSRFEKTVGWRAGLSSTTSHGLWRAGYDFTLNDIDGFTNDNDSVPQHRVRGSWETHLDSGWSLAAYGDLLLFDNEQSLVAGVFLERSF